ncbi:hypothetical protein QFZ82_003979 [Streptomyces sp. V4I23]|nr:hypothetical protein [Streptomyces sp. V4I23]
MAADLDEGDPPFGDEPPGETGGGAEALAKKSRRFAKS